MKKPLLTIAILLTVMTVFCQQQKVAYTKADYEDLMKKSKGYKTGAITMVCAGSAMVVGGVVMMTAGGVGSTYYDSYGYEYTETNDELIVAGLITSMAGIGVGVGSITLWVKSHKFRKQAQHARVSMNTQYIPITTGSGAVARIPQPGLTLTIALGR